MTHDDHLRQSVGLPELHGEGELRATPDQTAIYLGEENELASTCVHCGWPIFLDTERDEEGELIDVDTAFWQHNDDRFYTPGRPSVCPQITWEDSDRA